MIISVEITGIEWMDENQELNPTNFLPLDLREIPTKEELETKGYSTYIKYFQDNFSRILFDKYGSPVSSIGEISALEPESVFYILTGDLGRYIFKTSEAFIEYVDTNLKDSFAWQMENNDSIDDFLKAYLAFRDFMVFAEDVEECFLYTINPLEQVVSATVKTNKKNLSFTSLDDIHDLSSHDFTIDIKDAPFPDAFELKDKTYFFEKDTIKALGLKAPSTKPKTIIPKEETASIPEPEKENINKEKQYESVVVAKMHLSWEMFYSVVFNTRYLEELFHFELGPITSTKLLLSFDNDYFKIRHSCGFIDSEAIANFLKKHAPEEEVKEFMNTFEQIYRNNTREIFLFVNEN